MKRRILPAALLTAAVFAAAPCTAATPPFRAVQVSITAREQPVGNFLQALFGQSGLTAVISPDLRGSVNGDFKGAVSRVYGDISRAFNLLTYFDGARVYVYPGADQETRDLPIPPDAARAVEQEARRRGLPDSQNRILISSQGLTAIGASRFLDQVEEIARRSAQASRAERSERFVALAPPTPEPLEYRVYYLRYGWAEDVTLTFGGRVVTIPGVASILRALATSQNGQPAPMAQRSELPASATVPGLRGQGLAGGQGTLGYDPANGPMPGPLSQDGWRNLAGAAAQTAPQGGFDSVRVQADTRLNAIIVRDTRVRLDAYDQLIRALDVEPQLLEIQASIIEIDIDKARELGVNFRLLDDTGQQQLLFGNGTSSDLTLRPGVEATPSGRGAFLSTVIGNNPSFVARVNALETEGVLKVVARPQVLTLSNVEAVFDASRTFYVRLAGERDVDLFNVTAGTTLRVTPHVTRDKGETRIRLLVAIEDGSLTSQAVDSIPVVERAGLNTQALIQEGQSLLLGGMISQQDSKSTDKTPVLGDIPGLGLLFRTTQKRSRHLERLFLITPKLASLAGMTSLPEGSLAPLPVPPAAPPATPPSPPTPAPRVPS